MRKVLGLRHRWSHGPGLGCARPQVHQAPGACCEHVGGEAPPSEIQSSGEMATSTGQGWKWRRRRRVKEGEKIKIKITVIGNKGSLKDSSWE